MNKKIVGFGEVLWDMLPGGRQLGGAPLNFIFRVNGLGDEGVIISRVGTDALGNEAIAKMRTAGMDISCIQSDSQYPTGTVDVTLDDAGHPDFNILPDVAYDYIEPTPDLLSAVAAADCICFGTLSQRASVSRQTLEVLLSQAKSAVKLLDINLRKECYTPATVTASLERADLLKLNDDEALELSVMLSLGENNLVEIARALVKKFSLQACVITLGSKGAMAVTETETAYAPGFSVDVVDTVGAGDSFTAGFVHKFLQGCELAECCEYGNAVGAIVAGRPGGTAQVSCEEIEQFKALVQTRLTHEDFL